MKYIFLFLFINSIIFSNNLYEIRGVVINEVTLEPVSRAKITFHDSTNFYLSDSEGYFSITNVQPAYYELDIEAEGYYDLHLIADLRKRPVENLLIKLKPYDYHTPMITVTDESPKSSYDNLNQVIGTLKGKELQKDLGNTLAATLKNETGISIRSMGPAPSRPVFRGLSGDRVIITENGIKTNDLSATAPDHAVTIEPFGLNQIEIIRGPKVLLSTSTSIGGVVNVINNDLTFNLPDKVLIKGGAYYETVNKGYLGMLRFDIPFKKFVFNAEGTKRMTDNMFTPAGELKNSSSELSSYNSGLSYIDANGFGGITYRYFKNEYGIPGGFTGAHPLGVNISMTRKQYSGRIYYKINSKLIENIEAKLSFSDYVHYEFEHTGNIGAAYQVKDIISIINLRHSGKGIISNGIIGLSSEYRKFVPGGYVFTPLTKSYKASFYLYENLITRNRFNIELSLRYNFDKLNPEPLNPNSKIGYIIEKDFHTISASSSAVYSITKKLFGGISISRSSRVPTIEELYSQGPHLAAYSYETGNPNLGYEYGYGSEYFAYYKADKFFGMINFFYNYLPYYIISQNTGQINNATLLPVYKTTGVKAVLYGIESTIDWRPEKNFEASLNLSYAKGDNKNTGNPLPMIPPLKGIIEAEYKSEEFEAGFSVELSAAQKRVDEFEESTAGYGALNFFFQTNISIGKTLHSISLNVDNFLDKEYRNHLSRVKSILPEGGRNFRLIYKVFY